MARFTLFGSCLLLLFLSIGIVSAQEPEQIGKQVEALLHKAKELKQQGRIEEAVRVHAEAMKLAEHAKHAGAKQPGGEQPSPEQLHKHLEALMHKARELKEQGRGEDAARVHAEAEKIAQHLKATAPKQPEKQPAKPEAKQEKIAKKPAIKEVKVEAKPKKPQAEDQPKPTKKEAEPKHPKKEGQAKSAADADKALHIRAAAEHLKAAGLTKEAESLLKKFAPEK